MTSDKRRNLIIAISICVLLSIALFVPVLTGRILAAIVLVPAGILTFFLIPKRTALSYNRRQVLLLMSVIGALFVVLYYLTGLRFGFVKSPYGLSGLIVLEFLLPTVAVIISIEMIRAVLLEQKSRAVDALAYFAGVVADVLLVSKIEGIETFNRFMDVVGLTLVPALAANFLYSYLSRRYGAAPNIVYRLLTTLYPYIFITVPKTPDSLFALFKLLIPLVIYAFLRALYDKDRRRVKTVSRVASYVGIGVLTVLVISIVMLISCQFRFGLFVIKTGSMTGELNVGDAVVYERYEDQVIGDGDVVVFEKDGVNVIHRVVKIEHVNGQARYYTKGDANEHADVGYITHADIVGVPTVKIPYIGYPTLWFRDLFA